MKARAPYRLECFDYESPVEVYGVVPAVDTLAGAALRFVGWDAAGAVVWDSAAGTATATVTDGPGKAYAATCGPLAAGPITDGTVAPAVYRWEVQRTDAGRRAVLVWGYLTVTGSPPDA